MSKLISGNQKHLSFDDRIFIEDSLNATLSFKDIARYLCKDPTTISKEVRLHRLDDVQPKRIFHYPHNFCTKRFRCKRTNVCGKIIICDRKCPSCIKCNQVCSGFTKEFCNRLERAPYVCNGCDKQKNRCTVPHKYQYDARFAHRKYEELRTSSREGVNLSKHDALKMDAVVTPLISQGQSPYAIVTNHPELDICVKTLYNYIDQGGAFEYRLITHTGKEYSYGIAISYVEKEILSEWLIRIEKNGAETYIFNRDIDENGINFTESEIKIKDTEEKMRWEIYLGDFGENISESMKKKSILSDIAERSNGRQGSFSEILDVFIWFQNMIIIFPTSQYSGLNQIVEDEQIRNVFGDGISAKYAILRKIALLANLLSSEKRSIMFVGGATMDYITTKEAAANWGISDRRVLQYCNADRIEGAIKIGNMWLIPKAAEKPIDGRTSKGGRKNEKVQDFDYRR